MKNKPEHSANAVEIQNKKHLWKKGESGNPAGKKTGTRHRTTLAVERLLDGEGEELTRKAIELAKEGDLTALKAVPRKNLSSQENPVPINIDLPDVKTSEGVSLAQTSVVQAVGEGEITPEEGQVLSNILESRRKSIESEDHEQ